jgi:DNA processing protein
VELAERGALEVKRLRELGGEVVIFTDPDYPELLRRTAIPPPVLYARGRIDLLNSQAVAIVGSRSATSYGRRATYNLARALGRRGVTVISGLAEGIDTQAHIGCLEGEGDTIAVLGCGLDVVYPRSNKQLYTRIAENGLLLSEYPLGSKPEGFRFPARNRLIAWLSRGVVVVEAARKSGTMITVQHALDEGREVGAVPGQIDSVKSHGTHWLLQQGASLIVSADDVFQNMQLEDMEQDRRQGVAGKSTRLSGECRSLLCLIEPYPMRRDELQVRAGLESGRLSQLLLLLELEGVVEMLQGDRVRKVKEVV